MDEKQQELMIKLSMYEQQINQIQQQIEVVEQTINEMGSLSTELEELIGSKDKEIYAGIGKGIYAKAKLLSEELIVDVGEKNFVRKSVPETKKLIEKQIEKLKEAREELQRNLESISSEIEHVMIHAQGVEHKD